MKKNQTDSLAKDSIFKSHFPLISEKGFCDNCMRTPIKTALTYGLSGDLYCYLCNDCFAQYNQEGIFTYCKGCGAHLLGGHGLPLDSLISKQLMYCKNCRNSLLLDEAKENVKQIIKRVEENIKQIEKTDSKKKNG